ncbi:MAG: hypothetical protein FJ050_04855, partial [Cyanobacteria bacterium M_surface_7_m2_040]|nr:hypothetical protein [Cyanobacteria bacterium M_surface_7_m2_040]
MSQEVPEDIAVDALSERLPEVPDPAPVVSVYAEPEADEPTLQPRSEPQLQPEPQLQIPVAEPAPLAVAARSTGNKDVLGLP